MWNLLYTNKTHSEALKINRNRSEKLFCACTLWKRAASMLMLVIEQEQYLALPGGYSQREGFLKTTSQWAESKAFSRALGGRRRVLDPLFFSSGWWASLKKKIFVYGRFFSPLSNYVPDFPSTDSISSLQLHARQGQATLQHCQNMLPDTTLFYHFRSFS